MDSTSRVQVLKSASGAQHFEAVSGEAAPSHRIYPYEPALQLAENLWQVRGSLKYPIPRNMTVWRAPNGDLLLYSVVAMHDAGMRSLEQLGRPAIMIIPHRRHHMDAPFYKARYPQLRVLAPAPGVANGVPIDGGLEELEALQAHGQTLPGTSYDDVALDLPVPGGRALCVCELLTNVPPSGAMQKVAFRLLGPPGGDFGISRIVKWREVVNRAALRDWLTAQSRRTDLSLLLLGHGEAVREHVAAALARAARQV